MNDDIEGRLRQVTPRGAPPELRPRVLAALAAFTVVYFYVAMWLPAALTAYARDGSLLLDGDGGQSAGANISDAMFWGFTFIPVLAVPFAVLGAAFGTWIVRKLREAEATPIATQPS